MLSEGACGDCEGILEITADGYGFLRTENYLPGAHDVYVAINQIRKFDLKTGDKITGKTRPQKDNEKNRALLYICLLYTSGPYERGRAEVHAGRAPERRAHDHPGRV